MKYNYEKDKHDDYDDDVFDYMGDDDENNLDCYHHYKDKNNNCKRDNCRMIYEQRLEATIGAKSCLISFMYFFSQRYRLGSECFGRDSWQHDRSFHGLFGELKRPELNL